MDIFKIGFAIAGVFIGGISALVGAVVTLLALKSGEIGVTMSNVAPGVMVSRAADPSRYWTDVTLFGILPAVLGAAASFYAWRRLKSG